MEIYVSKNKKKLFKENKYKYKLIFHEHGYSNIEYYRNEDELYSRLCNTPIYKSNMFPCNILSIRQFIDKGFSIYY